MTMRVKVNATVRINAYDVISSAIEAGVNYGLNRAYKHTDKPDRGTIYACIERAVSDELFGVLILDGEP